MERNGYEMTNDIMNKQKEKRKKNPMNIFLEKQTKKTNKKNKSQHNLNEISKYKNGNSKGYGKR